MQAFEKNVFIGITDLGRLNISINWDGRRLSITGTEGPLGIFKHTPTATTPRRCKSFAAFGKNGT